MTKRLVYYPKKQKKTRQTRLRPTFWIFIGGIAISGLLYAPHIPQLQISSVQVEGINSDTAREVRAFIQKDLQRNKNSFIPSAMYFAIRTRTLAGVIAAKFPQFKKIEIHKRFPSRLIVRLAEHELFAVVCNDAPIKKNEEANTRLCAYADREGLLYAPAPTFEGRLLLKIHTDATGLHIGGRAITPELLQTFASIAEMLKKRMNLILASFEWSEKIPSEFRATEEGGIQLIFRMEDDYENAFRVLNRIWEEEIGDMRSHVDYIDLRFGNKVFFKLKS